MYVGIGGKVGIVESWNYYCGVVSMWLGVDERYCSWGVLVWVVYGWWFC